MDIKIGTLYVNRTLCYLTPILRDYPPSFVQKLNQQVFKLSYGISDKLVDNSLPSESRPIYILCDKLSGNFDEFIEWLRTQDYYLTDYVFGSNIRGRKHMVVINTIDKHIGAYDKFCVGSYSKMYSKEDLDRLYLGKEDEHFKLAYKVLNKEKSIENVFISKINSRFGEKLVSFSDFYEPLNELDYVFKLDPEKDIFNYNL